MWDHGILHPATLSYLGGAMAGLAGGAAMLLAFAALGAITGADPLWVPKRIAGVLLGRMETGNGGVALGIAVHIVLSTAFGVVYAIVVTRLTHEFWMTGAAYALTLWVINYWGGHLSPVGRQMTQAKPAWLSPIVHVVYGAFMALVAESVAVGSIHV